MGKVAFEAARIYQSEGGELAFVALIDALAWSGHNPRKAQVEVGAGSGGDLRLTTPSKNILLTRRWNWWRIVRAYLCGLLDSCRE